MPLYGDHDFQGENEKLLYAAAKEPTFADVHIASIFGLMDWTAFRSFRFRQAERAKAEIIGRKDITVTPEMRRKLQAHKDKVEEYTRIFHDLSDTAKNIVLHGYIRTKRSTEDIAQVLRKIELGDVQQGPSIFNPTAAIVEIIYDSVKEIDSRRVKRWEDLSVKDKEMTDMQEIFRIYFKLPEMGPPLTIKWDKDNRIHDEGSEKFPFRYDHVRGALVRSG